MSGQTLKLTILPQNKTVVFYSPVEGRDVLVRTGVSGEGDSFFHSLLHAYSKEYAQMDKKGREKFVKKLKKSLSENMDRKRWEKLSDGMVARLPFQEKVEELVGNFYSGVKKGKRKGIVKKIVKNDEDIEAFKVICELLPQNLIPLKSEENEVSQIREKCLKICKENFDEAVRKLEGVDEKRKKYCVDKLLNAFQKILDEAEEDSYQEYVKNSKETSMSVDSYLVGLLSEKFRRDVYFIDSRTRIPYLVGKGEHVKGRKSLVVMWLGGSQYEIVGRLLPGHRVQREFYADDPLIKRINTFLFHPELVPEQYPNLVPFLEQDKKSRRESKKDSKKDSKRESKRGSQSRKASSESNFQSESESKPGSQSGSDSEDGSDSGSNSGDNSGSKAGSDSGSESGSGDDSGSNSGDDSRSESGSKSGQGTPVRTLIKTPPRK